MSKKQRQSWLANLPLAIKRETDGVINCAINQDGNLLPQINYTLSVYKSYALLERRCIRMITTCVFQNGNSQALRIPQEMRTDKKDFFIRKIGDTFIAYPTDDPWAPVRQVIGTFPTDFMSDRNQPAWEDVTSREEL